MTPFECYQTYVALKQHFTTDYDYFKYNGKCRASYTSFEKRKDVYQFSKLSKKRDVLSYLVSNFVYRDIKWPGDLFSEEGENVHQEQQKTIMSISRVFDQDMKKLNDDFKSNFVVSNGQHPQLLRLLRQKEISYESFIILDSIVNFIPHWDKKITDPVVWPSIKQKMLKYKPFLNFDEKKFKKILKNRFSSINNTST